MTAHWGVPDPAAVEGTPEEIEHARSAKPSSCSTAESGCFSRLPLCKSRKHGHQARNRQHRQTAIGAKVRNPMSTTSSSPFSGSLSDGMDFRRHGCSASLLGWLASRSRAVPESLQRRHNLDSHRGRPDPHDVSAIHEGPLRRTPRSLPQQARAGAFAGAELGRSARC